MPDTSTLTIHVAGDARKLSVAPTDASTVLTSLLRAAELPLNTRCGLRGLCDGCLVELLSGELIHVASGQSIAAGESQEALRACEYRLAGGSDAEIRVPGRSLLAHEPQVVTSFSVNVSRAHDPLWQHLTLSRDDVPPGDGLGQAIVHAIANRRDGGIPVRQSQQLQTLTAVSDDGISLSLEHRGDHWLASPLDGDAERSRFGLAIDIGTTTVVVLLVDLGTGDIVDTASALNGQTRLGDNVLTRIQLCLNNRSMISRLQKAVASRTIHTLVLQLLNENEIDVGQLASIVVAGNTTMLHLLAGVDPGSMGTAPFTAQFLEHRVLSSHDVPLRLEKPSGPSPEPESESASTKHRPISKCRSRTRKSSGHAGFPRSLATPATEKCDSYFLANPKPRVAPMLHLLPGAAAYVGADIMAGVLSSGMAYSPDTCLLVDVGTNGEIVLQHGERLLGCATAAGPAFEGSGLSCGVRAGRGAISHIHLDESSEDVQLEVIGDAEPIGLCGTAYVDFVAQAHRVGLINQTGRFTAEAIANDPRIREGKHSRRFLIATGRDEEPIHITELDIASLLQAKAAIAAGIVCLLQQVGLSSTDVKTLYLAGGFGFHMDIENVIHCGLLPGFRPEQISMVGNTSLAGAYLALVDSSALDEIRAISARVETIELNLDPTFESCYIDQLSIPG